LRELEPVNPGVAQLDRQHAASADDEGSAIDHGLDLIGIDPGQGYQNENFPVGLQHIDRRFPAGLLRTRRGLQAEELPTQPFGARKRIDCLGQHPVDGIF
jgi:hypothetical protein